MLPKTSLFALVMATVSMPLWAASADLAAVEFADTTADNAQTASSDTTTHYAYIEQTGLNKLASIVQSGVGNWASIVQTGLNADQAYIVQNGTGNRASIVQR
jgi:hypothetical protein